jgi:hypothetical protein
MLSSLAECDFSLSLQDQQNLWKLVLLCGPLVFVQAVQEYTKNLNVVLHLSVVPRSLVYAATVLIILTLGSFGQQAFIYFQF